jgi:hypothetical protein
VHGNGVLALPARGARRLAIAALAVSLLGLTSCVVLPVRIGPAVEGQVVDQASGKPLAGAIVVVRFDGRYDDVLPDRDLIGHQEAQTDASGRFVMDRIVRPGFSAWPLFKTEARVVGVMREGYRCAAPRAAPGAGPVRIALTPALDALDRRESCRPVTAERGEVTAYMDAWRTLFADSGARPPDESERQAERLLAARTVLGFGENCSGPVTDLAVAPDGARAAFRVVGQDGAEMQRIELANGARRAIDAAAGASQGARLAWVGASELVLVEPGGVPQQSLSTLAAARTLRLWSAADDAPPAAPAPGLGRNPGPRPLDPEDLSDESDRFWRGRSFALARTLDPTSGLPADELRITREDGSRLALSLPGEACGQPGRFGRPHYRMAADGRSGLDLRFVDGGCHAVRIDLETGAWKKLDAASTPATCETARRIPAVNLSVALRGYMREVESALAEGGADPAAAFVLEIAEGGEATALTRDFAGGRLSLRVPRFPLSTPLRRIDVSTVGLARPATPDASSSLPMPEPL